MADDIFERGFDPGVAGEGSAGMERAGERQKLAQEFGSQSEKVIRGLRADTAKRKLDRDVAANKDLLKRRRDNFNETLAYTSRLEKMDSAATDRIVNAEKKFKRDQYGRKFLTERQLVDWMGSKRRSEEEWKEYASKSESLHKKKLQFLQASYAKLEQAEKQAYDRFKGVVDRDVKENIAKKKSALQKKIAEQKRKSGNMASIITGVATIGGAIIGGVVTGGNPAGAATGATIGSQVGPMAAEKIQPTN